MPDLPPPPSLLESLRAALEFGEASGAWIVQSLPAARESEDGAGPQTADEASPLEALRDALEGCRGCRLSAGRTRLVFGVGSPRARLLFVGEGPGEEEDRQGEPFVGRAGKLLDKMIGALGLQREDVYIANVVKCRPPGNRDPQEDEVAACSAFLWRQIEAIRPTVVCTLGAHAARVVVGAAGSMGSLRGRPHRVRDWIVLPTYHPAYLLRNPAAKRLAWDDLRKVRGLLDGETPSG